MTDMHFDDTTISDAYAEVHSEVGAPTLADLITELASARGWLALRKNSIEIARKRWEAEHSDKLDALEAAKERVNEAERAVRTATHAAYLASGDKKPHAAVGIRMTTIISYNEADARAWAMDNLKMALKLDTTAFDKAVRAKLVPADIASIEEVAQTTIASDLSAYIIDDQSE